MASCMKTTQKHLYILTIALKGMDTSMETLVFGDILLNYHNKTKVWKVTVMLFSQNPQAYNYHGPSIHTLKGRIITCLTGKYLKLRGSGKKSHFAFNASVEYHSYISIHF